MIADPRNEWKNLSNIDEILNYTTYYPSLSKWQIFKYFSSLATSDPMFHVAKKLINSPYFNDKELYQYFINENHSLATYNTEISDLILEKIKKIKPWKEYTDIYEIKSCRNKYIKKQDEDIDKLMYFANTNETIFRNLTTLEFDCILFDKISKKEIKDVPEFMYEYFGLQMSEMLSRISTMRRFEMDINEYVRQHKNMIIKCSMTSPENAYSAFRQLILTKSVSLKSLSQQYDIENIKKLPLLIRKILINPNDSWKFLTNAELIGYRTPKGKEWEVLEYFAKHNPEVFNSLTNQRTNYGLFNTNKILDHYKDVELSTLPEALQQYIVNSQKSIEDAIILKAKYAEERQNELLHQKENWLDKNGNLLNFFKLEDNFPITSKQDYLQIAQYFRASGLSISKFCFQYKIDSIDGFRKMLLKICEENQEFKSFYDDFVAMQQKNFLTSCSNILNGVLDNSIEISEIISSHDNFKDLKKLLSVSTSILDENKTFEFIEKIIEYYYQKLNSYDESSTDLSEIDKTLSFKDIIFFSGVATVNRINSGLDVNIFDEFIDCFGDYKSLTRKKFNKKLFDKETGIQSKLKRYETEFCEFEYMNDHTSFTLENGELLHISNDMIDMALCYLYENKLFKCKFVMGNLIKAAAYGKLNNQEHTRSYKNFLQNKVLSQIKICTSLEEYFESRKTKQPI